MIPKLRKKKNSIKRFFLNIIFQKNRVFEIPLNKCITEFGQSFGKDGDHFFVKSLNLTTDQNQINNELRNYYSTHHIKSFFDFIDKDCRNPDLLDMYFLPWEVSNIRPIEKFKGSHMIGPTPEDSIPKISIRLLNLLQSIKKQGFKKSRYGDNVVRVYELVNGKDSKFIIKDGQHRISIASTLGISSIYASYNSVYYFRNKEESIINRDSVDNWPKVKNGMISKEDALTFFDKIYNNTENL